MDSWTSKEALFRDLARAQGGAPIAITEPLLSHEIPREYDEEKEAEYQFRDASATTDFSEGPDIKMIMHMLEMVNDYDDISSENQTIEISKLNPLCQEFSPKSSGDASCMLEQKSTVKKKNRNAAIESIMKAQEESISISDTSKYIPPTLRNKPIGKNVKLNLTTEKKQNGLKPIVYNSSMASTMFKKKTVSNKTNISPSTITEPAEILKTNTFVPSKVASSYYEKFVEFNEAKEVKNDIWAVVQNKMSEFEERKRREAELTSSDTSTSEEVSSPPLVQESSNEEKSEDDHQNKND